MSREEAIKTMRELKRETNDSWYEEVYDMAIEALKEQKTGRWVNANEDKWNTVEVLKCSVCGEMDNRMYRTDKYCPNCGARMECEEDG